MHDPAPLPKSPHRSRGIERSKAKRRAYLALIDAERASGNDRPASHCANLAHAYAGTDEQRDQLKAGRSMEHRDRDRRNDMPLSAHAVYYRHPEQMKIPAHRGRATAQVAGGVPAMCDGVTQGYQGMELPLFSRDNDRAVDCGGSSPIALSRARCCSAISRDKIVPGW